MDKGSKGLHGLYQAVENTASGKTVYRARIPDDKIAIGTGWSFSEAARDLALGLRKQAEWIKGWMNSSVDPSDDQDGAAS
nr:hypothetical protein [Pseudoxanthomonas sp.]